MKPALRIALALGLAAALGYGLFALGGSGGSTPAGARRWQSSAQCRACHAEVWNEWHGSHHQIAFLNPEVRKLSEDFRNKECQACHLPRPVFEIGLGKRTLPRLTRPDEGVDCLTCHLGADGGLVSRNAAPTAPCQPRAEPAFTGVLLCESCHNQHQTTDQFRASRFAAEGGHCNDCHMPQAPRAGVARRGRSHAFPGAHAPAMLRAAPRLELACTGGELVVAVTNTGAGHNLPTEERHRAVDVLARFVPATGEPGAWTALYRFRQPYRDEPGENTQLPAGATKTLRVPVPAGAARAEVRLWYRLNPYASDTDPASTLLVEQSLVLP